MKQREELQMHSIPLPVPPFYFNLPKLMLNITGVMTSVFTVNHFIFILAGGYKMIVHIPGTSARGMRAKSCFGGGVCNEAKRRAPDA